MRKICASLILALAVFVLMVCSALADTLPAEIQKDFGADTQILAARQYGDTWFVLGRRGKTNTLYCYRQKNNGWSKSFHAVKSVPQGEYGMEMGILDYLQDPASSKYHDGPILMLAKYSKGQDHYDQVVYYQRNKSGQWMLVAIIDQRSSADTIEVGKDYVEYYTYDGTNQKKTTVKGTIQRDIRYLSLESFPMNASAAKSRLTFAPDMPANSELQSKDVQFTGGKKYNVYSAPDKNSLRGANGKASVSTNGWIQVFGEENGWILIHYSIDKDHYRFGYIESAALPKNAGIGDLGFHHTKAVITSGVSVTDDPLYSQNTLAHAETGEEVAWLATMGSWAYIEGPNYRGFVPLGNIGIKTEKSSADIGNSAFAYKDASGNEYNLFEIVKLRYDNQKKVYAVDGVFERILEGDEYPYADYAEDRKVFTYSLSPDFSASMIGSMSSDSEMISVNDLYSWYVDAYMNGQAPEGEMLFQYDLPSEEQLDAYCDFWFVTVKIRLNQNNEIQYMEYVYVPWG